VSKFKVYLYVEGAKKAELKEVSSDCTYRELLKGENYPCESNENGWFAMRDDSDVVVDLDELIVKDAVKNKVHVHLCRCKKVEVAVTYNGVEKTESFPPSAKIKRILKWALREFGISEEEASVHVLSFGDEELNARDSIGLYVSCPDCNITLSLTREGAINGWM